ncbi:hypothetical protein Tco_1316907 [Tanacetum coccineum]
MKVNPFTKDYHTETVAVIYVLKVIMRVFMKIFSCQHPTHSSALYEIFKDQVAIDGMTIRVGRIQKKGVRDIQNGDRYAPFFEGEWTDDIALMVTRGEAEDDVANGDETRVEGN